MTTELHSSAMRGLNEGHMKLTLEPETRSDRRGEEVAEGVKNSLSRGAGQYHVTQ